MIYYVYRLKKNSQFHINGYSLIDFVYIFIYIIRMKLAKYQKIEDYIVKKITNGELQVGDQIPTENELCDTFHFSRMTVSKALENLSNQGLIQQIPGKGSFVTRPSITKSTRSISSFTEDMASIGLRAGSSLIQYRIVSAAEVPEIAAKLRVHDNDMIHFFERLRTGDNKPIAMSYSYISAKLVPAIDINSLNASFQNYLDSIGITPIRMLTTLSAVNPTEEQKQLLRINNTALLCNASIMFLRKNGEEIPYEYTQTFYNGTMYSYTNETYVSEP